MNYTRFTFILVVLLSGLSPKHVLLAQDGGTSAAVLNDLKEAEAAFERGRPDYILARRALEGAEATADLRLQARANLLQAKLDSAGRRYSRALPYFNKAKQLTLQAEQLEAEKAIETSQQEADQAEQARIAAEQSEAASLEALEAERSAAQWKYLSVIGICLAILAAGILGFLATVRKLRGDIKQAEQDRNLANKGYEEMSNKLAMGSRTALNRMRKLLHAISARMPVTKPGEPASHLAAQSAALVHLSQASFEQQGKHEVAMEAFFEKYNPELVRLLNAHGAVTLRTESMPLRLSLDDAIPVALIYTELVANAFKHGGSAGQILAKMTKEGSSVTMTVKDPEAKAFSTQVAGEGRKFIAYLADELKAKVDYPGESGGEVRVRFAQSGIKGAAAAI